MMDCDTLGVEPEYALVKEKKLVGGGSIRTTNGSIRETLGRLGYDESIPSLLADLEKHGAFPPEISKLDVFDCAAVDGNGRSISVEGHLRMMAAVQPFLSGAISKTVNIKEESTVEDVERTFHRAWKLGLKSVTIYRDNSKGVQPLAPVKPGNGEGRLAAVAPGAVTSTREKLPDECPGVRKKFEIGGEVDGYVHAGLYPSGRVGEVFIRLAKEGSALSGFADALATAVSIGLQYGVPLDVFVEKFSHWRFEPLGYSSDPRIGFANSIVDFAFRWLGIRFPGGCDRPPERERGEDLERLSRVTAEYAALAPAPDAPFCAICSSQLRRNGSCFVCPTCGATTGCS
jgi:ribonucleoside-diphosphate reductase alpha chain